MRLTHEDKLATMTDKTGALLLLPPSPTQYGSGCEASAIPIPAGKTPEDLDADDALATSVLLGTVNNIEFHHIADISSAPVMRTMLRHIHDTLSRHKLASLLRQFY
jgi:hypothetical protein